MKIHEVVKITRGNGGKVTRQYGEVPDLANPIARVVLTQPHLRQRAMPNKKAYNRKKAKLESAGVGSPIGLENRGDQ